MRRLQWIQTKLFIWAWHALCQVSLELRQQWDACTRRSSHIYTQKKRTPSTLQSMKNNEFRCLKNDRNSHFSALEIQSEAISQALQSFCPDTFSLLRIFLPPVASQAHTYFCHIFCFHYVREKSHWDVLALVWWPQLSFQIAVFKLQVTFKRVRAKESGNDWFKNLLAIFTTYHVSLCRQFSISAVISVFFLLHSLSASYPLRSWWAPGGAAAWSRRTPAPRCPPSAAPPSPRSRSALLHPRPTPGHHTQTRTRSLSRPPRPRGRQDQRSLPALHSSSPAPTPALHRPTRTGRAPPGTRLLPAHSLNPVWVRLRMEELKTREKLAPGLWASRSYEGSLWSQEVTENSKKLNRRRKSTHADLFFTLLANETRESKLCSSLTVCGSLSLWLPHCKVKGGKMRGSGYEWGGRGDESEAEGRCGGATVEDAQPLVSCVCSC